jgi:hypothetical protein
MRRGKGFTGQTPNCVSCYFEHINGIGAGPSDTTTDGIRWRIPKRNPFFNAKKKFTHKRQEAGKERRERIV